MAVVKSVGSLVWLLIIAFVPVFTWLLKFIL